MKWKRSAARLLVVAVALMTVAGAFAPVGAAAADSQPQPPQRYFGTVSDDSGQGVGGLTVQVTQNGDVVAEDVTDSDGYYDLQVDVSDVDTDQQVTISVHEQTKNADVESGGSTEVDFAVDTDTVAGGSGELDENGQATVTLGTDEVSEVSVDLDDVTSGTVAVRQTASPADGAPEPPDVDVVAVYLDIDAPDGSSGTVSVTVTESALDDAGLAAEDAKLLHYDGSWETLETTVDTSGSGVTLTAPVDGFSPFAVAGSSDTTDGDTGGGGDGDTGGGDNNTGGGNNNAGGGGGGGGADTTTQPTTESPTTQPTTESPSTTKQPETTEEPSETTDEPATTEEPTPEDPGEDDDSPGPVLIGGILIVLVAIAAAAYLVYGRE